MLAVHINQPDTSTTCIFFTSHTESTHLLYVCAIFACLQVRQVLGYERDRVRFLLKAYLRARLEKVQHFAGK
jgi:hypothetical protein